MRRHLPRAAAFTMLEIMFAIMILGVGLIAVAAIFPVSATLQRNTFDDMMTQQITDSVIAAMNAHKIDRTYLTDMSGQVVPLTALQDTTPAAPTEPLSYGPQPPASPWPIDDRSYPTSIARKGGPQGDTNNASNGDGDDDGIQKRKYFWTILYRWDAPSSSYQIFVIIMRRATVTIPRLSYDSSGNAAPDTNLAIGEPGLDAATGDIVTGGTSQVITGPPPHTYWHGQPAKNQATTMRILSFGEEVLR